MSVKKCYEIFNQNTNYNVRGGASPTFLVTNNIDGIEIYGKFYFQRAVEIKKDDFLSLDYERRIYKYRINNLLKQSPNFIPFIGEVECSFNEIINNQKLLEVCKSYKDRMVKRYGNDIGWENSGIKGYLTKKIENGLNFQQFINNNIKEQDFRSVIAQVLMSLQILYKNKINHNDLHLGNISIQELPKTTTLQYDYDVKIYHIYTKYKVYIFDWDYSYVDDAYNNQGEKIVNPKLNPYQNRCKNDGMCNKLNDKFDLYVFISNLYLAIPKNEYLHDFIKRNMKIDYILNERLNGKGYATRLGKEFVDRNDIMNPISMFLKDYYFNEVFKSY